MSCLLRFTKRSTEMRVKNLWPKKNNDENSSRVPWIRWCDLGVILSPDSITTLVLPDGIQPVLAPSRRRDVELETCLDIRTCSSRNMLSLLLIREIEVAEDVRKCVQRKGRCGSPTRLSRMQAALDTKRATRADLRSEPVTPNRETARAAKREFRRKPCCYLD